MSIQNQTTRERVRQAFVDRFGHPPALEIMAPGRINLIGEHTDYNGGLVLPAAVDKGIYFSISPSGENGMTMIALDMDETFEGDVKDIRKSSKLWANYLLGVLQQLQFKDCEVGGFKVVLGGDIPIGSGMSSSAALECGFAFALNRLFDLDLDRWDMVRLCQKAEHQFVGTNCGIMDQFASLFGKKGYAMMLDCREMEFDYVPVDLPGYQWVLINSMVKHSNLTSGYNDRVAECKSALEQIQAKNEGVDDLSMVSEKMLEVLDKSSLPYQRAKFVLEENNRVIAAKEALATKDALKLGKLLKGSHHGLNLDYEVSCPELNFLMELAAIQPGVMGSRMMGGGFGGCTLNLVESAHLDGALSAIQNAYLRVFDIQAEIYHVSPEQGVHVL